MPSFESVTNLPSECSVLICGGGPIGLTQALLLNQLNIDCVVLEKYPTRLGAPKAHAVNPRTIEIFRQLKLDTERLRRLGTGRDEAGLVWFLNTLNGTRLGSLPYERQDDAVLELTPEPFFNVAQPELEDWLRTEARRRGVQLCDGYEWLSRSDGVSTVRERKTKQDHQIKSKYLIACDGSRSNVRSSLDIPFDEKAPPAEMMTFHFNADITKLAGHRRGALYFFFNPIVKDYAVIVTHQLASNHVLVAKCGRGIPFDESYFTQERSKSIINRLLGTKDLQYDVLATKAWYMSVNVARTYQADDTFLVGDAAHAFPPTGGLGLNTGVADAHNLAWKIATVEGGFAEPSFLKTYDAERRPIAHTNADQSAHNRRQIGLLQDAVKAHDLGPLLEETKANGSTAQNGASSNKSHVDGSDINNTKQSQSGPSPSEEECDSFTDQINKLMVEPDSRAIIDHALELQREHFDSLDLQLGYVYGKQRDTSRNCADYVPSGEVGARLPHAIIDIGASELSTLDLVTPGRFTLVVTKDTVLGNTPPELVKSVNRVILGSDFTLRNQAFWQTLNKLDRSVGLLVRPDQHILARVSSVEDLQGVLKAYLQ